MTNLIAVHLAVNPLPTEQSIGASVTRHLNPVEETTASSEQLLEAHRIIKRLDEYDETIRVWGDKHAHAEQMISDTARAKERFIKSITRNDLPFWFPTQP